MSGSFPSRRRGVGGGLGTTTVLAAKVAFASAALAAAASFVPQLVSVADAFLWKLYLFVTVHVIIFVIWKLSDHKHFHAAAQHMDPWAPAHHPPPPPAAEEVVSAVKHKEEFVAAAEAAERGVPQLLRHEASPEEIVSPDSGGGESCVTTEFEEDASSAASTYIAVARGSLAPAQERAVLERELSPPQPPAIAATAVDCDGADNDDADDDLDATWNAIMQKTRPATAPASSSPPAPQSPPPPPAPRPRTREPSVGAAELSKRSADFIKKIHHSFGRQQ